MKNKALLVVISLLISIAAFVLGFFITFNIAIAVSPPYVVDESGEKHGVMAMGQAFLGISVGILAGIFSLLICYRKFKDK